MQGKRTDDLFHFFPHADELFLYLEGGNIIGVVN